MTVKQEEAFYIFLEKTAEAFDLDMAVSFVSGSGRGKSVRLAEEIAAYIELRNLAFSLGPARWLSRRGFFEPLAFVIRPTRLELRNGILIPGHRCVPFANPALVPQEYTFYWQGREILFTTTEGAPEEFYPYFEIFGEEYAPQYVAHDNLENAEAFNEDPFEDPPEISLKTLDMRSIYREALFVPGDRFIVRTKDWVKGSFEFEKADIGEWSEDSLNAWLLAAEKGFDKSFRILGPASCTDEQIAYAFWYGPPRMRELPAFSLEEFLYEKTEKIETTGYGIESRLWYSGREIPDMDGLNLVNTRPDKTPVEWILHHFRIPVSEYVVQAYIRDSLFREKGDVSLILKRLIPDAVDIKAGDIELLADYVENVLAEFTVSYNRFSDNDTAHIRQRAGELHTAVIDLAAGLSNGGIDPAWLPRHTFIILSQMQWHAAAIMEDLSGGEVIPKAEIDAIDNSLDSMIETYEDIKELIDEALDSYRRNKLSILRAGEGKASIINWLVQISITGVDVWRRLIVDENYTLGEFHGIIQTVFGWGNTENYRFNVDSLPVNDENSTGHILDTGMKIGDLASEESTELLYEYGTGWDVRIILLSRYETSGDNYVRCVAGDGAAPPELVKGASGFRKAVLAMESENEFERLRAITELGADFVPDEFDLDACNRQLAEIPAAGGNGQESG